MAARQSAATDRALRSIALGMSMYAAAKKHRLAYTTVWRAVQRQRAEAAELRYQAVRAAQAAGAATVEMESRGLRTEET